MEAIDEKTGFVVPQGDVLNLVETIKSLRSHPLKVEDCRKRAETFYDKNIAYQNYLELYKTALIK